MKLPKSPLQTVMGSALILFGIFVALRLWATVDREDTFFVDGAELSDATFYFRSRSGQVALVASQDKELPVFAHRIVAGRGVVLGYRWYSNGNVFAYDDESYEKLSVWFKGGLSEGKRKFDLSPDGDVLAVYTRGGAAWPKDACFGSLTTGSVEVEKENRDVRIRISGEFTPSVRADPDWFPCVAKSIQAQYSARQLEIESLTPWLGMPAEYAYGETYR